MNNRNWWIGSVFGFVIFALLFSIWITRFHFWSNWDSRFDDQALIGLSPSQVISNLGNPNYDPRNHGWSAEDRDGPLVLGYFGPNGETYEIEFEKGRVCRIRRSLK